MFVVDLETLGTADLTKVGTVNYAKHPDTRISVISWKCVNTGGTRSLVHPKLATKVPTQETLDHFVKTFSGDIKMIAHSAPFEVEVLNNNLGQFAESLGLKITREKPFSITDCIDTLILSNIFRGPGSLDNASKFFRLGVKKDVVAKNIMKLVCKGRKTKPRNAKTSAKKIPSVWKEIDGVWYKAGLQLYEILEEYCRRDVETTYLLFKKLSSSHMMADLGDFAPDIKKGVGMVANLNSRGVKVDAVWLKRAGELKDHVFDKLAKHSMECFGFMPGQRPSIKTFLQSQGYAIEGMGQPDIIKSFSENEGFEELKDQLKIYTSLNKTSLNKVSAAQNQTDPETGALKYMFRYCGAYATGRFTSYGVQLQNLPRTKKKFTIEDCKKMIESKNMDYDSREIISALRGVIVPRPGYKFFIADLSQIELRRVLVKAGYLDRQRYLVDGGDLYSDLAAAFFKKKASEIGAPERQIGKAFLLGLGYGMGEATFANNYENIVGSKIGQREVKSYIQAYRKEYSKVPNIWYKYHNDMMMAFSKQKEFRVKLQSGRYLNYGRLERHEIEYNRENKKEMRQQIVYFNGVEWNPLYGPKVFQQVVQAECRDILLIKMNALDDQGARIVMQIHDEVVVEVPEEKSLDDLQKLWYDAGMSRIKELFPEMIIDSDCVMTDRYWSH